MKKILLLMLGFLGLFTIATANTPLQPLNSIVAIVNKEIITQSELDTQLAMLKTQMQMTNQPIPPTAQLKEQLLNQLIDQKLVLQVATKNKIKITDEQLATAIANIAKQNNISVAVLKQQVEKQGMSYTSYEAQIRQQLLLNMTERQAIGNNLQVSNAEIQAAMRSAKQQQPSTTIQYHLEAILVPVSNSAPLDQQTSAQTIADNIIQQLQQGADFDSVALGQSSASQPLQGGDMGWKQLDQLPPEISAQIAAAVPGSVIGPIKTVNGYYILKVVDTRSVNAPQAAMASPDQIKQMLYFQKFEKAAEKWIKHLRTTAYIKIMNG